MISFYVPVSHLETVKNALFEIGVGKYDGYDRCCWQTAGQGQFRPLEEAHPFIGTKFVIEKVEEYKVEMICTDDLVDNAVSVLLENHPYEVPAYNVIKLNQRGKQ